MAGSAVIHGNSDVIRARKHLVEIAGRECKFDPEDTPHAIGIILGELNFLQAMIYEKEELIERLVERMGPETEESITRLQAIEAIAKAMFASDIQDTAANPFIPILEKALDS